MPTAQPKAGVVELTQTQGTGPYQLDGPATNWRSFVASDDSKVFSYGTYQDGGGFEEGEGIYNHSSRTLSRPTILGNHLNTTDPVDWGTGQKEVSSIIPAGRAVLTTSENKFLADQYLEAFRLIMDANRDSWLDCSTNDLFRLFLNAIQVLSVTGGVGNMTLIGTDAGTGEGPDFTIRRDSSSPAPNDPLGVLRFSGRDSNQAVQSAAKLRATWTSVTAGACNSTLDFSISNANALQSCLRLSPNTVGVPAGIALLTSGKTASSLTTAGTEMFSNGAVQIVCVDGFTPLQIGRAAGDGAHLSLFQNGVFCAGATTTGSTTTWTNFTGGHYGDFQAGISPEYEQVGTVLASTGALLWDATEPIYELAPAVNGDPCVLGVWGGRHRTNIMGGQERNLILMFGIGNGWIRATGPIAAGNLLWASATPGIAEAQPDQDQIGPWTVAKASANSPDAGSERLISCIYMAG